MKRLVLSVAVLAGLVAVYGVVTAYRTQSAADSTSAGGTAHPGVGPGEGKIAFLELGSEGCKPCEAMKPVMQAVRDRFGEQVEVIFHDVKKNPSVAREYRVRLIPTQVFLKPDGAEFFRHEGFFSEKEVAGVLKQMGLR